MAFKTKTKSERIREAVMELGGSTTCSRLVDHARTQESSIHDCFEWDNEIGGELHRLEQARGWLRSIKITITPREESLPQYFPMLIATYENKDDAQRTYRSVADTMNIEEFAIQAVDDAKIGLMGWWKRFKYLWDNSENTELLESRGLTRSLIKEIEKLDF